MSASLDDQKKQAEIEKLKAETEKAKQETIKNQTEPHDIGRGLKIFLQVLSALGPMLVTAATGIFALVFAYKTNLFDSQTKYAEAARIQAQAARTLAQFDTQQLNEKRDSLSKRVLLLGKQNNSITTVNKGLVDNMNDLKKRDLTLQATVRQDTVTINAMRKENVGLQTVKLQLKNTTDSLTHLKKQLTFSIDSLQRAYNNQMGRQQLKQQREMDNEHESNMDNKVRALNFQHDLEKCEKRYQAAEDSLNVFRKGKFEGLR